MVKITPIQKTNSLYSDKNVPFKCLSFLYKTFYIVFGLDFGFIKIKSHKLNLIKKIFPVLHCTLTCSLYVIYIFLRNTDAKYVWYSIFLVQYFANVLTLSLIKEKATYYNLIQDLKIIDLGLKVHHGSYNLEKKQFLIFFLCIINRIFFYFALTIYFRINMLLLWDEYLFAMVVSGSDIVCVTYAFMFYAIHCRLKKLGTLLESQSSGFLSIQYLYKSIVDIAEQHKNAFDPVLIMSLLVNVPQAMASMLLIVKDIQNDTTATFSLRSILQYITITEMLFLSVMPALCAGMLTTQANNIKVILHNLQLQQQDEIQYNEIEGFIRYVEARGCRFHVWKVIPLDADLLGMVLSFCVNYLIVIIQFTNK